MASDKPQSEILDLLYDDELDEETRAAARRDVEQSDEAREELQAYETMLAKIREVDLDEDVPASVHDSIMASARKHATKNASRQAQVTRRAPTTSKPSTDSLWSRMNSSGVSQLVLAAAVVLVGGFIFFRIGSDEAPQQAFMSANDAVDQQVTFGGESASELAENAAAPESPQSAEEEPAQEELAEVAPAEETAVQDQLQPAKDKGVDKLATPPTDSGRGSKKSKIGEIAQLDQADKLDQADQLDKRAEAEAPRREDRTVRRRARKSASRTKKSSNDEMEVFRGSSSPSVETKKSRPAPAAAEKQPAQKQQAAKLDDAFANSTGSTRSSSPSKSGVADSADLGNTLGALADSSADSEASSSAAGAAAQAESEPVPTQEGSEQAERSQEQTSSVNTMESNYRSGNFAGVVNEADRYLARSSDNQADEARVLELKARALARQGKSSEADGVYAELQKKYPSYKSDQIRRERADLTDERKSKAKRRRQAPAEADEQRQYDFDDQEAAEPQPSSIDQAY